MVTVWSTPQNKQNLSNFDFSFFLLFPIVNLRLSNTKVRLELTSIRHIRLKYRYSTRGQILVHYSTYYSTLNNGRILNIFQIAKRGWVIRRSLIFAQFLESESFMPIQKVNNGWLSFSWASYLSWSIDYLWFHLYFQLTLCPSELYLSWNIDCLWFHLDSLPFVWFS